MTAIDEFVDYALSISSHSNIRKFERFLSEFVHMIASESDFPINIDTIAHWIDARRDNLIRYLEKYFEEGLDYVKEKVQTKGRILVHWFLTKNSFKELLLMLRSDKSKVIRRYFIDMEEMYRNFMLEKIEDRRMREDYTVEEKKKQFVKVPKFPTGSSVYVIRIERENEKDLYKLGRTIDMNRRFKELQRQIPGKLEVIYHLLVDGNKSLEMCTLSLLQKVVHEGDEILKTKFSNIKRSLTKCSEFVEQFQI